MPSPITITITFDPSTQAATVEGRNEENSAAPMELDALHADQDVSTSGAQTSGQASEPIPLDQLLAVSAPGESAAPKPLEDLPAQNG